MSYYDASKYYRYGYEGPRYGAQWHSGADGVVPGTRAGERQGLGGVDPEADAPPHTKYPPLSDYPLVRKSTAPEVLYIPVGEENQKGLGVLGPVLMAAGAYHGYKRNGSVLWALAWGVAAAFFPIPTGAIAVAQGYGKKK